MRIHRSRPEKRFTTIPDETLRDERLSYAARGVLAELLSRPDDWRTNADAVAARAQRERGRRGEGRDPMRAAFAELAAAGYLFRITCRDPRGRCATVVHVFDVRQDCLPDGTPFALVLPPVSAGRTDDDTGRMPVRPGQIGVSPGRTDDDTARRRSHRRRHGSASVNPSSVRPAANARFPGRTDDDTGRPLYGDLLRRPITETEKEKIDGDVSNGDGSKGSDLTGTCGGSRPNQDPLGDPAGERAKQLDRLEAWMRDNPGDPETP